MNIAILAPHLRKSGGTRILFSYANELVRSGHDVTVYVRSTNRFRRFIANLFQIGKPSWITLRARVRRIDTWDSRFIREHDHILAGGYREALALVSWSNIGAKGWYFVQHDEGLFHGLRSEVDYALRSSLAKIVVSSWLADVVRERSGQKSILLTNPYDRGQFFYVPKETHATTRILLLDHTYEWKGTTMGVRIINNLKKKYPNIFFVGMGRRRKDVAYMYDEYFFDPKEDDLCYIYRNADIFLCPSLYEGFGLPSLEAMACGTAVVTFDNGGSRDFAFNHKTAYVAYPTTDTPNEQALQKVLEEAILDPAQRDLIAKNARKFVESMPTWEHQVKKLLEALNSYH